MVVGKKNRRAFTTIELLAVIVILGVCAKLVVGLLSESDAVMRADRAAKECVTAIRYARTLAFTSGNVCGVRFNTSTRTFSVWQNNTPGTAVTNPMAGNGGSLVIDLANARELAGTTMTVSLSGDASNPYDLSYTALGATSNTGTITFTYAGKTKVVTVPAVGDPTLN